MNLDQAITTVQRGRSAQQAIQLLGEHFHGRQAQLDLQLFAALEANDTDKAMSVARQKLEAATLAKSLVAVLAGADRAQQILTPRQEME